MAQLFQDGVDRMQQWFISTEQELAELRNAERVMLHLTEATERAKVRNICDLRVQHRKQKNVLLICFLKCIFQVVVEEIQIKSADLGEIQKSGQDLMKALSGNVSLYSGRQGTHSNSGYKNVSFHPMDASCKMFICKHPNGNSNLCSAC